MVSLLGTVRTVPGVRDAEVRIMADGDRTLLLSLVDGADQTVVASSVARILDERLGVTVDPTSSVLVEDGGAEDAPPPPVDGPRRRVHLERLQVASGGLDVRVDVVLATPRTRVVGTATGPAVERAVLRTVASAALNAVDALLDGRGRCGLDQADLAEVGSDKVAIAVVTLLTPDRVDRLAGSALVRGDARQAMVRAVLAALNRRFDTLVPDAGCGSAWHPRALRQSAPLAVENTATFRALGEMRDDTIDVDDVAEDVADSDEAATSDSAVPVSTGSAPGSVDAAAAEPTAAPTSEPSDAATSRPIEAPASAPVGAPTAGESRATRQVSELASVLTPPITGRGVASAGGASAAQSAPSASPPSTALPAPDAVPRPEPAEPAASEAAAGSTAGPVRPMPVSRHDRAEPGTAAEPQPPVPTPEERYRAAAAATPAAPAAPAPPATPGLRPPPGRGPHTCPGPPSGTRAGQLRG